MHCPLIAFAFFFRGLILLQKYFSLNVLAPLPEGHVGQIISFSHEIGPECVIATSFQALLATFADESEAGIYVVVGWSLTKEENIW
jgi:hypothetical protein